MENVFLATNYKNGFLRLIWWLLHGLISSSFQFLLPLLKGHAAAGERQLMDAIADEILESLEGDGIPGLINFSGII